MSQEPSTLYWHGRETVFDEAVLHGLYENDLTTLSYGYQPQGLETIPSLAQGDAAFRVVPVDAGDKVVDADGNVVSMEPGTNVITAEGELVTYNGSTLLMQQLVADFLMKQRYWADGQPVTAADSVYSFRLAAHPDTPGDKFKIARTASYEATGNLSIRWAGLPGFRDDSYQTNFQHPLPQHAWKDISEAELVAAEPSSRLPLGDGPYRIVEWLPGEIIRLEPNPFYYRTQEDLPRLDSVTFLFIPNTNQRISQLLAGRCQIITHDELDQELIPFFLEAQNAQLLKTSIRPGRMRWQISFGVNSWSEYGDGIGRPDWFEDARVRQAVAMCINRQQIVDTILSGHSVVPHSYVPSLHPSFVENVSQWPYDQTAANVLLDEVGYLNTDGDRIREDPITGTDFRVSLITSVDRTERQIAQMLKEYLLECGIDLLIEPLPEQLRFADGEENRISGRRFDLALTTAPANHIPACDQFASWEISGPDAKQNLLTGELFTGWDGKNHSGWSDPTYDTACTSALDAMTGTADYSLFHEQAQVIFSENLPVLPLFFSPRTTAIIPEIPYINNDPSQNSELWNLFAIDLVK
jgi:peptide/nickel transport system substrate-binding protein